MGAAGASCSDQPRRDGRNDLSRGDPVQAGQRFRVPADRLQTRRTGRCLRSPERELHLAVGSRPGRIGRTEQSHHRFAQGSGHMHRTGIVGDQQVHAAQRLDHPGQRDPPCQIQAPGAIGLVAGGRVADRRGRRLVATVCTPIGAALIVTSFWFGGPLMWSAAVGGSVVAATAYPSLAVYRTELFPTGRRGRAAYLILASALLGGGISLLVTGALLDRDVFYGPILTALAFGPVVVAAIVWSTYPETAHRELEELNPEDLSR